MREGPGSSNPAMGRSPKKDLPGSKTQGYQPWDNKGGVGDRANDREWDSRVKFGPGGSYAVPFSQQSTSNGKGGKVSIPSNSGLSYISKQAKSAAEKAVIADAAKNRLRKNAKQFNKD